MSDYCFSFLKDRFGIIASECEACEIHLVNEKYEDSIIRAGKACELITKTICEFEKKDYLTRETQRTRLRALHFNVIPDKYARNFSKIAKLRNKAVHDNLRNPKDDANNIHSKLFEVAVWFFKNYGPEGFTPPEYNGPIYSEDSIDYSDEDLLNEVKPKIDAYVQDSLDKVKPNIDAYIQDSLNKIPSPEITADGEGEDEQIEYKLENYKFEKYNGSYLLNELSKLRDSSKEAIEVADDLTDFKNYIHVDRSIQDELLNELKRVVDEDSSHLVMLCGSVGDGKSHLLAYLKTNYPELYSKFKVHTDATESFDPDPDKNAIDTLSKELTSFNDDNINSSFEKTILAINLGILNNFLESEHAQKDYTKLKQIILDAKIFDSKIVSKNVIQDKVSFITFSDYNLFELNGDSDSNYISSNYIFSLFNKITSKNEDNPFYIAYLKDKQENYLNPLIYNYEMLMDKTVQKVVIDYLIKIFIEYKKIISTRDLLNFIYEMLVPPIVIKYEDFTNTDDFVDYLLPNLLFNSSDRSDLLNLFNKFDPTLTRTEELDKFIMKFNTNEFLSPIIEEYFDLSKINFLKSYFTEFNNLYECIASEKHQLISTLIRFSLFYGKSFIKSNFVDKNYLKFLNYLYAYNTQNHNQYSAVFDEVKKAIFKWKGSFKKDYLCIDELNSFKVSKRLKLKYEPDIWDEQLLDGLYLGNRFKSEIRIYFSVIPSKTKISLDLDYPLYSYIIKLNDGYKPNKDEKDNLVLFDEFINNLIDESSSEELIIKNLDTDIDFDFEYDDAFDSFKFGREE